VYSKETSKSISEKKKKRQLSERQYASIRLSELIRLSKLRHDCGTEIDADAWLFVICHTLAPLKERDGGLDLYHLRDFQRNCPLAFNADDAATMMHKVCDYRTDHPKFHCLSPTTVGKMLDVTADERWRCRITTIEAVDETKEQRESLRVDNDRERKERQRRARGVVPRAEYEAASLSQTKPWLTLIFGGGKHSPDRTAASFKSQAAIKDC